jgi:hypothetical protein
VLSLPDLPSAAVTVDLNALVPSAEGTYHTSILVEDPNSTNRRVTVTVTLVVQPAPAGAVSITSASIEYTGDGATHHTYLLTVSGTSTGPVGADCYVFLDADILYDAAVYTQAPWGDDRERDVGEPATTAWTYTRVLRAHAGQPREAFTVRVTAHVDFFPTPESVDYVQLEDSRDVQGY